MNRIEFAARCLARRDGVWDPDAMVMDRDLSLWENLKIRMAPDPERLQPAWRFYLDDAVTVIRATVTFEVLKATLTDEQILNLANGGGGPGSSREDGYGVPYDHPLIVAFNAEVEELFP